MEISADLIERAIKAGATANVEDALAALIQWPQLRAKILGDLERAIVAHEEAFQEKLRQICYSECPHFEWRELTDGTGKTTRVPLCTAALPECPEDIDA